MKTTTKLLAMAGVVAIVILATPSSAQQTRFYLKGDLGGNWAPDIELKDYFGPVAPGSKIKLDAGFRGGVAGGYQFNDWFAGEAELGFIQNKINSITDATRVHDAWLWNIPFLLNAKVQFPNRSIVTPYIGAGAGFSTSVLDVGQITIYGDSVTGNESDAVFAYQAFAGLRFKLDDRMSIGIEYRYFGTEGPEWEAEAFFGGPAFGDRIRLGRVQAHTISVAFDYRF